MPPPETAPPNDFEPLSPPGRGQGEGPPTGSTLALEELPTGLTVRVPPVGFGNRMSLCLLLAALALDVFAVLAALLMVRQQGFGAAAAFFAVCSAVSVVPLLVGLHMAKRQAAIALVDDRLMILQMGVFGSKRHEWALDELDTIEVGPSGWLANGRPILQLQIRSHQGETFGMLAGHEPVDLEWLADILSRRLEPPIEASPEGQAAP